MEIRKTLIILKILDITSVIEDSVKQIISVLTDAMFTEPEF